MRVNRTSDLNKFVRWFPEVDRRLFENLRVTKLELVVEGRQNCTEQELSFGWNEPHTFIYEKDERLEA